MAVSMNAFASDNNSDKKELQQLLKQTQSLSAEFEQQVKDEQGNVLQTLSGNMKLKRPASLYWHTLSRWNGDGRKRWKSLVLQPICWSSHYLCAAGYVDNSPLLLVLDNNTNQWQNYSVSHVDDRYLVKHNNDASQLELVFDGNTLTEITLVQAQGERTELMLSDVVLNPQIDGEQFTFEVPAGVDVDDQS